MLTFDEFVGLVRDEFGIDATLSRQSRLVEDLNLDSLAMLELLLLVEEISGGQPISEADAYMVSTLGDAYAFLGDVARSS